MTTVLGIDVGGTHIRSAARSGRRVHRFETRQVSGSYLALLAQVNALHQEAERELGAVGGVGIGLPGVVCESGGQWIPNLPFLDGEPLVTHLHQLTGLWPVVANDAQLALLGELWRGAARGCRSAALLSLGTGIGGAYAVSGRVVRGASGSAGSFGWLGVSETDAGDPQHGPLERLAAGRALERLGQDLQPPLTPHQLIAAARQGDDQARALLDALAARLGRGVASLVSILDPEVLLVSGGLGDAFDLLGPALQAEVQRLASPSGRRVPVRRAQLGDFAGVYGALRAASLASGQCFL